MSVPELSVSENADRLEFHSRRNWMFTNLKLSVAVAGVLAMTGPLGGGSTTARGQDSVNFGAVSVTHKLRGRLDGEFSSTSPPPLLTLSDFVSGHSTVLGEVTGNFAVIIDFNQLV